MRNWIIIFSISIIVFSCDVKNDSERNIESDTLQAQNNEPAILTNLLVKIDLLYSYKNKTIDTLEKPQIASNNEYYGFNAFKLLGYKAFFKYGEFSFLEFDNSDYAKNSFNDVIKLIDEANSNYNSWNDYIMDTSLQIHVYYDIIHKSGVVYILFKNLIIKKERKCNDDYKQENKNEENILKFLYKDSFPNFKYLIRSCCSCPMNYKHLEIR